MGKEWGKIWGHKWDGGKPNTPDKQKRVPRNVVSRNVIYNYDQIKPDEYYHVELDGYVFRQYSGRVVLSKERKLVDVWIGAQMLVKVEHDQLKEYESDRAF